MTSEQVHAFLDRFRAGWQHQDVAALVGCYTDDCEVISPIFHSLRGILDSEHNRAAAVWTFKSKHQGEIFGVPPTGRALEITIAFVLTFADGKIAREVRIYDFAKMLLELGVLRARA